MTSDEGREEARRLAKTLPEDDATMRAHIFFFGRKFRIRLLRLDPLSFYFLRSRPPAAVSQPDNVGRFNSRLIDSRTTDGRTDGRPDII